MFALRYTFSEGVLQRWRVPVRTYMSTTSTLSSLVEDADLRQKKELDTITNIQSDLTNRQPRQQLKKVTSAVKPLFGITFRKNTSRTAALHRKSNLRTYDDVF